ncbi:MAG: TIGR01906 family membrane protein [Tissierellia bacterium]|nr:TIGR01906 family membrane protein [Tissierellia bacterium]
MKNKNIIAFILSFFVILLVLLKSVDYQTFDTEYYKKFQKENAIDKEAGKTLEELEKINQKLVYFIQSGKEEHLVEDFNTREISHMKDVYNLYSLSSKVQTGIEIVLFLLLIYFAKKGRLLEVLKKSVKYIFIILGIILILILLISTNFSEAFTLFHKIFFDNDLWILDPSTDLMIRMLPEQFFMGMAIQIMIKFIKGIIIYLLLVAFLNKFYKCGGNTCNIQEAE